MSTNKVSTYNVEVLSPTPIDIGENPNLVSTYNIEVLSPTPIDIGENPNLVSTYNIEVLHKFIPLDTLDETNPYKLSGTVTELEIPVIREVMAFNQKTFLIQANTTSDENGNFVLRTTNSGTHFVICKDNDAGEDYNILMAATVTPVEV